MTKQQPHIEIRLEGSAVPGRISVDALTNVAKELQTSLRRMLSSRQQAAGRFHGEVEQVCKLDLTAVGKGSAVLTFEFAGTRDTSTLQGDQGVRVAEEMLALLSAGEASQAGWQDGVQRSVLEGFERLTKPLGEGVDSISFSLVDGKKRRVAKVTQKLRTNLRSVTSARLRASEASIEGVLWECDWKVHTALLDEIDGNRVTLEFPAILEEKVTALRRQRVRVHGTIESEDGRALRMKVASIELLVTGVAEPDPRYGSFWDNVSAAEQARRQGLDHPTNVDALAIEWPEDESVDDFLDDIRKAFR